MISYPKSDNPSKDSTVFKLLNMTYCWLQDDERSIDISYARDDRKIHVKLTVDELGAVHADLPIIVVQMSNVFDRASQDILDRLLATLSHKLGSYVDLHQCGHAARHSHYLSCIKSISSSKVPGFFDVNGLFYLMESHARLDFEVAKIKLLKEDLLSAVVLDAIWPDASKKILVLESLGYGPNEVASMLLSPDLTPKTALSLPALVFE